MSKITFPFNAKDLQQALSYIDHRQGRYILGANQFWHGGIHLRLSENTKAILAPADGEIVAHRTMRQRTTGATSLIMGEQGNKISTEEEEAEDISHGFVLTRHRYQTPAEQVIQYYVLHMHLLCYDNYQQAHKTDPPPYLYKHRFFIASDEDDGGSLIGQGLRLRSGPKDSGAGGSIVNNVQTVLKKGQEIRFIQRGEYKHSEPPSGIEAYLEVEVLNPKTLRVFGGLVTTGVDQGGRLHLLPVGFDNESIESVRYDIGHQQRYSRFTINTDQDNQCGLALYQRTQANRGQDPLIILPFGYEIELLVPITLMELQRHALLQVKLFHYTQPSGGFIYCGDGYIDKQNTADPVGKFDQVEVLNPPMPIHSGEVIGYPGDYQRGNEVHMELWLENIDFFDNPKGDKRLSDALTLPQGIPAQKSSAPTGQSLRLAPEERLYWVDTLPQGVRKVRYGNPAQDYFVYHANLTDYKSSDHHQCGGYYSAKNPDGRVSLYHAPPEEPAAEAQEQILGAGEVLYLVRPIRDEQGDIRQVIYGSPPQLYYAKRSELGAFTAKASYRPNSADGSIILYPSNPETHRYSASTLPQFHVVESLPSTKAMGGKNYYMIEMPAEAEASEQTHYLVETREFDKHRLNYYDWKAFFLKKEGLASLGIRPSGYYPDAAEIRDNILEELNQHIIANTMQQLPAYQSEHPLINVMVKAGSEWSPSQKDAVNWVGDVVDCLWDKAKITAEQEQAGITKGAFTSCFNKTIKPFSDKISFYDQLAGIAGLPDKNAVWHVHPLKFLGHLDLLSKNTMPPWMKLAIAEAVKYNGIQESKEPLSVRIAETYHTYVNLREDLRTHRVAWCASFISWCLGKTGFENPRSAGSRFFINHLSFKPVKAYFGVIATFSDCNSDASQIHSSGHVALLFGKLSEENYAVLGGNQGNRLKLSSYDCSGRPAYSYTKRNGEKVYKVFRGFFVPKQYNDSLNELKVYASLEEANQALGLNIKGESYGESSR